MTATPVYSPTSFVDAADFRFHLSRLGANRVGNSGAIALANVLRINKTLAYLE